MELQFKMAAVLLIILACIHAIVPYYGRWKTELKLLTLFNRQLIGVHTFFIALFVFMTGLVSFIYTDELLHTHLGHVICFGLGVFWLIRLFFQFFVYAPALWKGKNFETTVHILFSVFWAWLSIIFIWSAI